MTRLFVIRKQGFQMVFIVI